MEVFVNGDSHVVADSEYCAEGVGAQTHVGMLAHELEGLSLFLHRIVRAARAENFDIRGLDFAVLPGAYAFYKCSDNTEAGSRRDLFQNFFAELFDIGYDLHILDCGAVVECNEVDRLAAAAGTNPAFHVDCCSEFRTFKDVDNLRPFYRLHRLTFCLLYSKAPMRSMLTSFSVRYRQSPRCTFFLVSPAK